MMYGTMTLVVLATCILGGVPVAQAQEKEIMLIPYKYTKPYEDLNLSMEKGKKKTKPWLVFSDRKNNKSYDQPGSSVTKKTLGFLEPFVVVEENERYIHIYKDPNASSKLSSQAIDYGWVKKENMLLWRKPLYNRKEIQKKAMILNTEEAVKRALKAKEGSIVKFFNDPTLTRKNLNLANIYSIFYIYKLYPDYNNPTAALLGTRTNINQKSVEDDIWGWVSYSKLTPWDHRVAILPNTDEKAIQERKAQNSPAYIFCDEVEAKKFKAKQSYDDQCVFWSGDNYDKKYIGHFMRSPILEDVDQIKKRKGVMKVGFIGQVEGGEITMDPKVYAKLQEAVNNLQKKTRSINIVFVIDGTTSMSHYFPKVSEAIIQCMEKLMKTEIYNRFKFAAVVYRDLNEGDRITQVIKLSSNSDEIANELRKVKAVEYNKGDDAPEAVFYGLNYAIRSLDLPPEETNNLILIGDAGNHKRDDKSQVSEDQIIELLTKYNYNFFVFQVHNKGTTTYYDFTTQTKQILEKTALNQFNNSKSISDVLEAEISKPQIPLPTVVVDASGGIGYLDKDYMRGGIYYVNPGRKLPPDSLRDRITRKILFINDTTNALLKEVQRVMMGGKMQTDNSPFWNYLSKLDIPSENLAILKSEHYQIYSKGFTPQQRNNMNYPLWEYQLFYTSDGLYELKRSLQMLVDARTSDVRRTKFKEAWMKLLEGHIGNLEPEELESKSIGEIEKLIFGLPGTSDFLGLRLGHLEDKARLPDYKFERWVTRIEMNLKTIEKIFNRLPVYEEYHFRSNDEVYFWIPQSFLP